MKKSKIISITKDLFNTVGEQDLLIEVARGKFIYKGQPLATQDLVDLISQAKTLQKLSLLKMLLEEMQYLCNKKIYNDSKNEFDILSGKMGLWFVDMFANKIKMLAETKLPQKL